MNPRTRLTAAIAAAITLGSGAVGALELHGHAQAAPMAATTPTTVADASAVAHRLAPDFRAIVKAAGPSVVGVMTSGMHRVSADENPFAPFFGIPRGGAQPKTPFRGQGSGFIVSADGLILTNAHVVDEAREVTVRLADRREFTAKVLGTDPVTDIAVLRIDAKGLPPVQLGNPAALEVGDPVLAIGAPYGLEQTATKGIVSAKGRSLPGDAAVPFLQTDAAVNPGNSGGPLFDAEGRVVGINAQIYSRSGGFQGLSFAIPIDVALGVKDQIVAGGRAVHARLGVMAQDLDAALAQSFGLPRPDGALVSSVAKGSAAAAAGLRPGDVITQVDGKAVERSGSLSSLVAMARPGDTVTLDVWRDGANRHLKAKLGDAREAKSASADAGAADGNPRLGLALRPLTAQEQRALGVAQGLVTEEASGAAERAGVEAGDVVLAINGQPVGSVDQLRAVLAKSPKTVALLIRRDDATIFVPVPLG